MLNFEKSKILFIFAKVVKNMRKNLFKFVIGLAVSLCYIKSNADSDVTNNSVAVFTDSTLNEYNVYKALLFFDIKYPEIVMSQIKLESSLTSNLCKNNNNLLGMTVPYKRNTTAINTKGFAKYKNWIECIIDYKLYQNYIFSKNNLDTKKKYIAYLHRNYAKSSNYKTQITNLSKKYETNKLRDTFGLRS
jgi:hypothetical protein